MPLIGRKDLYNIPGWHTRRHLVVIESDDWGSIRMPSREAYEAFLAKGIRVDKDPYCRYDNLATAHDLANLFEVLSSVKDSEGRHAVMTANAVTSNPVFDSIRASGFEKYFHEPFTETLNRSASHAGAFDLWRQGMAAGLFRPQLHGREHLNVKKWLRSLQAGEPATLAAFDLNTFGLTQIAAPTIKEYYMGAFNSDRKEDIESYGDIVTEGAGLFERIFGYRATSFIATTYEWSPRLEPHLTRCGIKYLQGTVCQKIPIGDDEGVTLWRRCFQGRRNRNGLVYLMRNCFFEPSTKPHADCVDDCLHHVALAFRWGKAANICSHRVNYIGSIDEANTDRNLPAFGRLLQAIVKRWPDVEFVSSDQLGDIITAHRLKR